MSESCAGFGGASFVHGVYACLGGKRSVAAASPTILASTRLYIPRERVLVGQRNFWSRVAHLGLEISPDFNEHVHTHIEILVEIDGNKNSSGVSARGRYRQFSL